MTISRCRALGLDELAYVGVSSTDPDGVGIEVQTGDGRFVLDVYRWRDGRNTVCLGSAELGFEIELNDLNAILARCADDLSDWEAKLRALDGPWSLEEAR